MRGKPVRLATLMLLLVCGCATKLEPSSYRIELPTIGLPPKHHGCYAVTPGGLRKPAQCVTLLEDDWFAVVNELKAACLANGQEPEQCQAILPPEP